jgi:hypothetical protein
MGFGGYGQPKERNGKGRSQGLGSKGLGSKGLGSKGLGSKELGSVSALVGHPHPLEAGPRPGRAWIGACAAAKLWQHGFTIIV